MGKAKKEYQCSDQNGAKTLPVGVAHTYIAYITEYLSPPGAWIESGENFHAIITIVFFQCYCPVLFSLESLNR